MISAAARDDELRLLYFALDELKSYINNPRERFIAEEIVWLTEEIEEHLEVLLPFRAPPASATTSAECRVRSAHTAGLPKHSGEQTSPQTTSTAQPD